MVKEESGSLKSAQVLRGGGEAVLGVRKDIADFRERSFSQAQDRIGAGLESAAKNAQVEKQQGLEAAARGLEYDPEKRAYRPTELETERQTAEIEGARAKTRAMTEETEIRREEAGLKRQQFAAEQQATAQRARVSMDQAVTDRMREDRLAAEFRFKTRTEQVEIKQKLVDSASKRIKDVEDRYDSYMFKAADLTKTTQSPFQQMLMESNPEYRAVVDRVSQAKKTGAQVAPEDLERVATGLKAERDMEVIEAAGRTGRLLRQDFSTPVMQRYQLTRMTVQQALNGITSAQVRAMQANPALGKHFEDWLGGSAEDREEALTRMSAQIFMAQDQLNAMRLSARKQQDANTSRVNTQGLAPAVTGGGGAQPQPGPQQGQPAAGAKPAWQPPIGADYRGDTKR